MFWDVFLKKVWLVGDYILFCLPYMAERYIIIILEEQSLAAEGFFREAQRSLAAEVIWEILSAKGPLGH